MELLDIDQYKKHFDGFGLRDCVVRSRDIFYFILFQDWPNDVPRPFDEELESRLVPLFRAKEEKWSHSVLTGFSGLRGGATQHPKNQCVVIDLSGQVYVIGSGVDEIEQKIPGGLGKGPSRGAVTSLKQIDGWLYGCDNSRSLFKRADRNQWIEIGPLPPTKKGRSGFDDFDAFSETDIYAAGGKGDVWHYDGKAWHPVPFPSNMWIESVCCGKDGYVYIGAQSGSVFQGRSNEWKLIHKGGLSLPFKDMVWFGDRVYATNDYGLWEIKDGSVKPSDAPIEITNCSGNLSVGDGVMLLAGHYGAALHDGTGWTRLFSIAELERQAKQAT
ncbi:MULTISPECIES: hypothetical protein [Ralstonia solanacearum species complex]|nr:hypothetical protein [Ralstonia solanacearum]BEU72599.1 hypothetical protein MAFF211271_21540 [Ralstonia pseudosolanacearum]